MNNPDEILNEMLEWLYIEPSFGDPTSQDVAWACDIAQRKSELDAVLEMLPRTLERADAAAAVSSIRNSVRTALLRYCAVCRAELAPYPLNEAVISLRDAYCLVLYLSVATLHALEKAPTDAAAQRLARLRHQIADYIPQL